MLQALRYAKSAVSAARAVEPAYARAFAADSKGPVYVIFGASGGIGSALATRLAKHDGAQLLLCGRSSDKLEELAERLGHGTPVTVDALDGQQVQAAIDRAVQDYGAVHGVANCVGSLILKGVHSTSPEEFRNHWEVNAMSAFNALKASVKPMMKSGGGSIVLFSSAVARQGVPNHEAIASAKAAVQGLALSAAATYAPKNIRVNCVAPGMTDTPLASTITKSEAALKASSAMHPLKRIGTPDGPAAVAELLLDPSNSNITGQTIGVDGGLGSLVPQSSTVSVSGNS